jgi:hypothetical protein
LIAVTHPVESSVHRDVGGHGHKKTVSSDAGLVCNTASLYYVITEEAPSFWDRFPLGCRYAFEVGD